MLAIGWAIAATVAALVTGGLWDRAKEKAASDEREIGELLAAVDQAVAEQNRQRRVLVSNTVGTSGRLATLAAEATRLGEELQAARQEAQAVEAERDQLTAQVDQLVWTAQQGNAWAQQEQQRAAQLEENLMLAQNDLAQQAADYETHLDSFQNNLLILRETIVQRETEVWTITHVAREEITRTQRAAEEIEHHAEWLGMQLRSLACERDRLAQEVSSLQSLLAAERHENQHLRHCIHLLECRVRELEAQLARQAAGAGNPPGTGNPGGAGSSHSGAAGGGSAPRL